jgi:hypothetical protein
MVQELDEEPETATVDEIDFGQIQNDAGLVRQQRLDVFLELSRLVTLDNAAAAFQNDDVVDMAALDEKRHGGSFSTRSPRK